MRQTPFFSELLSPLAIPGKFKALNNKKRPATIPTKTIDSTIVNYIFTAHRFGRQLLLKLTEMMKSKFPLDEIPVFMLSLTKVKALSMLEYYT